MTTPTLLLASDFDGTLAPIQRDPTTVKIDPEARQFFEWASEQPDVIVAFISGRDLDDLRERTGAVRAWRSGSHGQEIESPEGDLVRSASERRDEPPKDWETRATDRGLRLERKKFGIAVHWRDVEGVGDDHPLIEEFEGWATSAGLETTRGRCVIEAAVPGASKRDVLETLLGMTGATRLVYAGDDVTDLAAIEYASENGRGLFVQSRERTVSLSEKVERVDSIPELLQKLKEEVLSDRAGGRGEESSPSSE